MAKSKARWLWAVLFILPALLLADGSFLQPFQRLQILENGRQKPLDTFARNLLKQFSGRSTLAGQEASAWLARVLFTPGRALDDRIFLVNHPDVPAALDLPGQGRQRYSFRQLQPSLAALQRLAMQLARMEDQSRSAAENELLRLYVNARAYHILSREFRFAVDPGTGSREAAAAGSPLLAIIPLPVARGGEWLSPGMILALPDLEPPEVAAQIALLARAAQAFASGRNREFSSAIEAFNQSVEKRLPDGGAGKKISLEILYNRLEPFFKAQLAYGLALLLLLLGLLTRSKRIPRLGVLLLLAGLLAHSCGLLARMIIMNRPPVTNLYETFVFVAWTAVLLGLVLEFGQKNLLGVMSGAIAGLLFLLVAGRYSLEGDTLGMLAAVLDSNLWLTTHVVTISMGYAGCVIAGIIGHVYIIHQLLVPGSPSFRQRAARALYAVLAFGLVFTFIGTVMGGIWADQSWGRFWGWDPKENGALLIIVWCAILFHARLAGMIGQLGLAASAIVSVIIVVLAWFGVNLLGLGMHSYGFTSGIAGGLLAFVGIEAVFIVVTLVLIRKNRDSGAQPGGSLRGHGHDGANRSWAMKK
jgi:ABC-type transport system involved in cytochrome c biogenesis permease subunit